MIKQEELKGMYAKRYIITVLIATWLITAVLFINPAIGLSFFSLLMFVPGIIAVVFNMIEYKNKKNVYKCLINKMNIKSMLFGVLYPIIFVLTAGIIEQIIGIGALKVSHISWLRDVIVIAITLAVDILTGCLGEEYGWRGYLLPELTKAVGKIKATTIVGIVWALFHMPAVYLLAKNTDMPHPIILMVVQAMAAFVFSFAFSYCYYLSNNIIPVLFFHAVFNIVNTRVLGNIYLNRQGIIHGKLLVINGEGIMGVVLGGILMIYFITAFKKSDREYT